MILKFIENKRVTFGWTGWKTASLYWGTAYEGGLKEVITTEGMTAIHLGPISLHVRPKG